MLRIRSFCWSALLVLGTAIVAHAQIQRNGYIDTSFTAACFNNPNSIVTRTLLVQPDGKILVGGEFSSAVACANGLVRLRTNGVTDGTFASPLALNDIVTCIATQSNGKVIIGGDLSGSGALFPVARLNASGSFDGTFQVFAGHALRANALAVQSDDKIIVVGVNSAASGFIARFNINGSLDGSFNNASVTDATANGQGISAVALLGTKVLVGGGFSLYNDGNGSTNREGLALLDSGGSLDPLFHPLLTNVDVRALLVQPDGKILVAGKFDDSTGAGRCLTRLNANGTRDTSFTSFDGGGTTALSLMLEADGKILVGHAFGVMRITTNGVLDGTFGPLNAPIFLGTDATTAAALARTLDANILVGATSVHVNDTVRRGVARLFDNVPPAPGIVTQPQTQSVDAGTNVTFSVIATGAPPITYQWRKDSTKIKGQTNSTLALMNVHSSDIGNYTVIVSNPGGAVTSAVAHLAVSFQTSPLDIIIVGNGTVKPDLDGKELEVGATYTLTAKPASGNLFSNWTGSVTSTLAVLPFVMVSNAVLQANFVPSPFIPVKGVYNGLFFDTNAPAHENAGFVTLKLDDRGGFKGTVRTGAKARKFAGIFSLEKVAEFSVPASSTDQPLNFSLAIDTDSGAISGAVTNNGASSNAVTSWFVADRNSFSSTAPTPLAGNYNIVLPGSDEPVGDGFTTLKVGSNGKVSGRGTLADKTSLKLLSTVAPDGRVPVYVSLYRGVGSLFGWLTLTDSDATGTVWWTKPRSVGGIFYPDGFTNRIDVLGSRYDALPTGIPVLTLTNGVVIVTGGNLAESFTNSIALGGDNKIFGDNQLTLSIVPAKGTLSGSFVDPASGKKRALKGVALPNRNEAHGLFFGTDQSGRVFVGEATE
jgi:uncharacterized delta-60 repeat protein